MYGIFMESLVIFKLYTGLKLLLALTALCWIYLLFKEKDKGCGFCWFMPLYL